MNAFLSIILELSDAQAPALELESQGKPHVVFRPLDQLAVDLVFVELLVKRLYGLGNGRVVGAEVAPEALAAALLDTFLFGVVFENGFGPFGQLFQLAAIQNFVIEGLQAGFYFLFRVVHVPISYNILILRFIST